MADIVDDFLQRLQNCIPELPAHVGSQLEVQMRQAWGGTEPYVGKRPTRINSIKLGDALRQRVPLREVFEQTGLKRWNGYRLLRTK